MFREEDYEYLEQRVKNKAQKREILAERADADFRAWMEASGIQSPAGPQRSSLGETRPAQLPFS